MPSFPTGFAPGDRVAYALPPHGAYSQMRVYPADKLLKVPASLDHLDDRVLAASMLKGLTVQYPVRRTYRVAAGDVVLVHAAAGATDLLLCQWAKHLGATVIGTVGSAAKAEQARAAGARHVAAAPKKQKRRREPAERAARAARTTLAPERQRLFDALRARRRELGACRPTSSSTT